MSKVFYKKIFDIWDELEKKSLSHNVNLGSLDYRSIMKAMLDDYTVMEDALEEIANISYPKNHQWCQQKAEIAIKKIKCIETNPTIKNNEFILGIYTSDNIIYGLSYEIAGKTHLKLVATNITENSDRNIFTHIFHVNQPIDMFKHDLQDLFYDRYTPLFVEARKRCLKHYQETTIL